MTTIHAPPVPIPTPASDAALIGRSLGEPATFATVFERHHDAVHRYVARRLGTQLADELASETFTRAFDYRHTFDRTNLDARPWLFGIATNLMRGHWRTERRRLVALQRLAGDGHVVAAGAEALQADVLEAVQSLGRDEREALLLLAWADLSYEQIAIALAVPIGTVRSRISRARGRMRHRLDVPATQPLPTTPPGGPPVPDLELLRAAAPPAAPPTPAARDRARAALDRRVADAPGPRPGRRRRWLLPATAATAAVACAVVLTLTVRGDEPAAAAIALRSAAAAAERQPATPPLHAGQYAYTRSSDLWMTFTGASQSLETGETMPMFGVIMPVEREIWRAPDGRGWLRQTSGEATFLSARDRELWIAAGRPDLGDRDMNEALHDEDGDVPMATLTLTDDPDKLRHVLEARLAEEEEGRALPPLMLKAVGDYLRETATTPAQRAALYEVAATIDGVQLVGDVTDHAGRSGTAVAIDDPEQGVRHTLVFDPDTGALLEETDVTLATNPYGYDQGVTVGRSTYLESRVVDEAPTS